MDFPTGPEELTVDWLTDILRQAGALKRASVQSFEAEELSGIKGALSRNVLIRLTYDTVEEDAPHSFFTKFAHSDLGVRTALKHLYEVEISFYESFSHRIDLATPKSYYGAIDKETGFFILVLEDVSDARAGDRAVGCSVEEAKHAIGEIAQFHAAWWEHPELTQIDWLGDLEASIAGPLYLYRQRVNPFLEKAGSGLPDGLAQIVERLQVNAISVFKQWHQPPRTLVHRDYQLDNMLFLPAEQAARLVVVDWQTILAGRGPMDVSSFLGGNISIEDRRENEKSLLQLYHASLVENGVQDYTFEQCWNDYRFSMLDGLFRMVIALGGEEGAMREEQYLAHRDVIAPRIFAAVHDLNSGEFLT